MNKFLSFGITVIMFILILASCQYKFVVEPEPVPPDPTDTIRFATQIEPIFSDQGCTACHVTGGQQPDLTSGNAYTSITSGFVNLADPPSSEIYVHPNPDGTHYAKYTSAQAVLVLGWIEQGAINN